MKNKKQKIQELIETNLNKPMTGKVLWFSEREGNGIILEDDTKNEVYFDRSTLEGKTIRKEEKVKYYYNEKILDCLCAKGVKEI